MGPWAASSSAKLPVTGLEQETEHGPRGTRFVSVRHHATATLVEPWA